MPDTQGRHQTVIATLGLQPQVVTLGVDLLDRQYNIKVDRVVVIHTEPTLGGGKRPGIGDSLHAIRQEFGLPVDQPVEMDGVSTYYNRKWPCEYAEKEIVQLPLDGVPVPISQIRLEEEAGAAFDTLFICLREEKNRGGAVHLNLSGGYNIMGAYGLLCAMIHFRPEDKVWYILSSEDFQKSGEMHLPSEWDPKSEYSLRKCTLVPMPFYALYQFAPVPAVLIGSNRPYEDIKRGSPFLTRVEDDELRKAFFDTLTPTQQGVCKAICMGQSTGEIARVKDVTKGVINTHLTGIYRSLHAFKAADLSDESDEVPRQKIEDLLLFFGEYFTLHQK